MAPAIVCLKSLRPEKKDGVLVVTLESFVVLNFINVCTSDHSKLKVCLEIVNSFDEPVFQVSLASLNFPVNLDEVPRIAHFCRWPALVLSTNAVVSGLASVCRQIIKTSATSKEVQNLLGFRDASLVACSETSIWTKFCELDLIQNIKTLLDTPNNERIKVPKDISRFESHLKQPVRAHNIYKLARLKNDNKLLSSKTPIKELNIEHRYAEGSLMTLADILIFSCYQMFFKVFDKTCLSSIFPLTIIWYDNLTKQKWLCSTRFTSSYFPFEPLKITLQLTYPLTDESLYKVTANRQKSTYKKTYTKQTDVASVLPKLPISIQPSRTKDTYVSEINLDWSEIPQEAHPLSFDALPKSRGDRKLHQLENLAKAALKIARDRNLTIVDFCSGSGHLGILVAVLLPTCQIILVENKERSLLRAKERIERLSLTNVALVQTNLNYFAGKFDLGLSLHACGVATDLVLRTCAQNRAHFVCCPCCYGSIANCDGLTYPKSTVFRDGGFSHENYLTVCHSADQTHDDENCKTSQGYFCMDVVDNDRKFKAEELGYQVYLDKLEPANCTPKNNLLIGIFLENY